MANNSVSEWLAKLEGLSPEQLQAIGLTPEHVAAAKKEHLLERDYTQGKQRIAPLIRLMEQRPDLSLDDALRVYDWWQSNGATVDKLWRHRERLAQLEAAGPAQPGERPTAAQRKKWRDVDPADLYEAATLRDVLEDHHQDTVTAAEKRFRDWWDKEERSRYDKVADGYFLTAIDLVEAGLDEALQAARDPKFQRLGLGELFREAASRGAQRDPAGRIDFTKVARDVREERTRALKPIEEAAFQRGLDEGKRSQEGPSGPIGGARPGWRPEPTDVKPKTREETFDLVRRTVEQKHGRPLPV